MPEVRRLRKRGATIEVVAYGEVLFAPGAQVPRFLNRFSHKVRDFAAQEAPANKRPRWKHYGKPLKATMKARTQARRGISVFHLHSAVGSTAPYAYYVDQGTGVYNGSGPYPAAILPPWRKGEASLYESTWRPLGPDGRKVAPVYIKGQKGQHFFDRALGRAWAFMGLSASRRPTEGVSGLSDISRIEPFGLSDFLGNTPLNYAFYAQLQEWREWRDAAWNANKELGRYGGLSRRLDRYSSLREARRRASRYRRGSGRHEQRIAQLDAFARAAERDRKKILADIARQRKSEEQEAKRRHAENVASNIARNARKLGKAYRKANAFAVEKEREGFNGVRIRPFSNKTGYRVEWINRQGETKFRDFTFTRLPTT